MAYERTIAFQLWIKYDDERSLVKQALQEKMILPISKKIYKTTLRNVKQYVQELMQQEPHIIEVQIDRISSVGAFKRKK